jgi:ectoine hydroxylase-related dioxygenase (phytanoyl-CoA dioxygenase family)
MLLNKGEMFRELINNQVALALAHSLLGPHCLLSSITANIAVPGNYAQPLHADQDYMATPWAHSEVCNIAFLLDDFTADNGATVVVPGSHLTGTSPPGDNTVAAIPITAPRGSLICLDGRVWHGTGKNNTPGQRRRAIFCYFCKPYIRQQENITRSLLPEIRERLTPAERQLLGFDIWMALGAVNGLPPAWMDGRERIGPGLDERLLKAYPDPARSAQK